MLKKALRKNLPLILFKSPKSYQVVILSALWITAFCNYALFSRLFVWQLTSGSDFFLVASLVLFQFFLLIVVFSILTLHPLYRWVMALIFLITAVSSYFSDSFGTVIDRDMLVNALQTSVGEAKDLFTLRFLLYLLVFFALPTYWVFGSNKPASRFISQLKNHLVLAMVGFLGCVLLVGSMSSFYVSFFREHKELRVYSSPLDIIYATYQLIRKDLLAADRLYRIIGGDATIPSSDVDRELMILVVGETARSDHFSLNGYQRETNPLLQKRDVVSFSNVKSCGTSTAISVPCMFSSKGRPNFKDKEFTSEDNLLDILRRAGVSILWRDNNSSSKGAADRVEYQDFSSSDLNPLCDTECRDEGMLADLETYIESHPVGDILIVLHQMGSHGPAYNERVPDAFKRFAPVCESKQLDQCSEEEIINSYDNTIVYTDYVLDKAISVLKKYDDQFETVLMYVGDHGESLGEKGVYLHGLPYFLAPDAQKNVPLIIWFGAQHHDLDIDRLARIRDVAISHDHVFHTMLGIFEVESEVIDPSMDLEALAEKPDIKR
jgi:lipid A ethanolaminephosphotransferase